MMNRFVTMRQLISRSIQTLRALTADQVVISLAFIYLAIPIGIFFLGWLKLWFAVPLLVLLALGTVLSVKTYGNQKSGEYLNAKFLIVSLVLAVTWVLLSGIGGYGHQNFDFNARNAVFHDLINHSWPVTYDYSQEPVLSSLFSDKGVMVYYFAFWLPAAVLGKLAGWGWANFGLFLWSVAGVWLALIFVARYLKNAALLIIPVFILASGMDYLGWAIVNAFSHGITSAYQLWDGIVSTAHLDDWLTINLQYSSFTSQLFYVFNQAVPAWIGTLLVLNTSKRTSLIFIWALVLHFAPLPALGLLPLLAYKILVNDRTSNVHNERLLTITQKIKGVISIQNIVCAIPIAGIAIAFFALTAGTHEHGFLWQVNQLSAGSIVPLIAFYLCEFLILGFFLYALPGDLRFLTFILVTLSLMPIYSYGRFNDLVMRESIPILLALLLIALKTYFAERKSFSRLKGKLIGPVFAALFLVGSVTPLHEIHRSVVNIIESSGFPGMKDKWKTFDHPLIPEDMHFMSSYVAKYPQEDSVYLIFLK